MVEPETVLSDQSDNKSTPRPWTWCEEQFPCGPDFDAGDHEPLAVYQEDGEVVCYLDNHYRSKEEAEANAALIVKSVNSHDAFEAIARRVHAECGQHPRATYWGAVVTECRSCFKCGDHAPDCLWLAADAMKKAGLI